MAGLHTGGHQPPHNKEKAQCFGLYHLYIPSIARHAMTTAGQSMPLQYDGDAVHSPTRMSFDEGKLAQMQWAGSLVAQHRRSFSIEGMRAFELAGNHGAAAAGGITQANGMAHGLFPGMRNLNGSAPWVCWFFVLRALSGGRTICTVTLPSSPLYTTALTPPS